MIKENKTTEERLKQMEDDIRDIRNDVATIKSNTLNIDRISTLTNTPAIIKDIMSVIGRSEVKAAVLHLTKEEISASDLSKQLGQDPTNLAKFTGPFGGKKGYLIEIKRGRNKYFVRGPMVDLVNIDNYKEFADMIKSWQAKRKSMTAAEVEPAPVAEQTEQKSD